MSKTQRNSHRLQGRTPASINEEQMEKEVSQDPLSHIPVELYLEHIYAGIL